MSEMHTTVIVANYTYSFKSIWDRHMDWSAVWPPSVSAVTKLARRVCRSCQNVSTSVLSGHLSQELIRTIRNKLPSLTTNIQGNISTLQKELQDLGEDMPEGRGGMVHAIIEVCNKFQEEYKFIINHV
jgi:hypothetical protein